MAARPVDPDAWAWFDGMLATRLRDLTDDAGALEGPGFWAVVVTFEGDATFARFSEVRRAPVPRRGPWRGPPHQAWRSSLTREEYLLRVEQVRQLIAAGDVYQVNLCRVLTAALPADPDPGALHARLQVGNPAPYAGVVDLPARGVRVVTASPELFLSRRGSTVTSGPIKGTGRVAAELRTKDVAENVMITDLVRNDLGRVARTGSVSVPDLCVLEHHPGLVHLVSRVRCQLADDTTWADLLRATTPPGSVSGAPKSSALRAIANLEPTARGPYCGAVGWVRDRVEGSLAVGIRTFWFDCDHRADPADHRDDPADDRGPASRASGTSGTARNALHFGTGAGIVWDSDPLGEWEETALKARRLIALASASTAEQRPGLVPDAADTPKGAA